jgi:hypothetical protein
VTVAFSCHGGISACVVYCDDVKTVFCWAVLELAVLSVTVCEVVIKWQVVKGDGWRMICVRVGLGCCDTG